MPSLDWPAIEASRRVREPFEHMIVPQALTPECAAAIPSEFPVIRQPGSYSLADAPPGPVLQSVIAEMTSERFRAAMAERFEIDLEGRPIVATLRGQCGARDGRVHVDSASKILSLLLYLNEDWRPADGRLRLLRSEHDLASPVVEVAPNLGTLLVFRRSERSWHGHTSFVGQRRVLQLNYLHAARDSMASALRHRLSALSKRLVA